MILNYNCYQVQQGDPAPSLGSPFCYPPTPSYERSVNWNWWHDVATPTGGRGKKQPFVTAPAPNSVVLLALAAPTRVLLSA